jgi:nitrogen fixation NifU-like protein
MSEALYQALVMDRTKNPRHAGKPDVFDARGQSDNKLCGDKVDVYLRKQGSVVHHVSEGCAIMVASADLMADAVAGLAPDAITQRRRAFEAVVTTGVMDPSLGALNALASVSEYRSRIRCATLPWSALADALGE